MLIQSFRENNSVVVKEEPSSPDVEVCPVLEGGALSVDTPLSPTTFINSILQDETQFTTATSSTIPTTGSNKRLQPHWTDHIQEYGARQVNKSVNFNTTGLLDLHAHSGSNQ